MQRNLSMAVDAPAGGLMDQYDVPVGKPHRFPMCTSALLSSTSRTASQCTSADSQLTFLRPRLPVDWIQRSFEADLISAIF